MITGRCLCGACRYSAKGPVLWAGHCHCDSCRRAASAPFASWFGVPRATLDWSGPIRRHASSDTVERGFCETCGSALYYTFTGWPDETHLYAVTLDDPTEYQPQAHYHYLERLPWITPDDDLPKYPGSADTTDPL